MMLIFIGLIVCIVAVIVLLGAKPNLFMFQLIEKVFSGKNFIKK